MTWASTLSWENAQGKAELLRTIRAFFAKRAVIEVETPLMSQGTITDCYLDAFSTKYHFLSDDNLSRSSNFYLQTSPEFAMKRLLASGYGSIYQICKAFRNEAYGSHHNPEFTILEWYRLGMDHFSLISEVDELLQRVLGCEPSEKLSYQQLFINQLKIDPLEANKATLLSAIKKHNMLSDWLVEEQDPDVLLQFIFSEIIEPTIGNNVPCFVYDFPRSQASLAKISSQDTRVAERFECYFKGLELANGFNELTDSGEQRNRFEQDNALRAKKNLPTKPIDEKFLAALNHGIPDCAGVALGIDRLLMLALGEKSIKNVITFPIEHA